MRLICAATEREMDACLLSAGVRFRDLPPGTDFPWARMRGGILFAVTGVGIPMTLARLIPLAARIRPEWILNTGIAGAYPGSGLSIGDLVAGESEVFGDLGMETPGPEAFLPLATFPWADEEYRLPMPLALDPLGLGAGTAATGGFGGLHIARGCTVNACTGREETGARRRSLFGAGFETMEGAAAALAGRESGIPVSEVRAISNIASTRDFRQTDAETAMGNLGVYMGRWLGGNA
ncbi:MAG: mqnB [Fibrobacteres bacterium]|nr:mqnB [Fibrobacterota bacterium]